MRQRIHNLLADFREMLSLLNAIRVELEAIAKLLEQIDPGDNAPGVRFTVYSAQLKDKE